MEQQRTAVPSPGGTHPQVGQETSDACFQHLQWLPIGSEQQAFRREVPRPGAGAERQRRRLDRASDAFFAGSEDVSGSAETRFARANGRRRLSG